MYIGPGRQMILQKFTRRALLQWTKLAPFSSPASASVVSVSRPADPVPEGGAGVERVFFPEHFRRKGETDDGPSIQRAVDTAFERRGSQLIALTGTYVCRTPITLRPGTILDGSCATGYYGGRQYYTADSAGSGGGRLVAGADIGGGLLRLSPATDVHRGYDIRNLTVDANKLAGHCLHFEGGGGAISESLLRLTDVTLQGARSDGVRLSSIIVVRTLRMTISACNGFGFNAAHGVSDSENIGAYIHTCTKGGVHVGEGSIGLRFIGGKIEDNYGNNVEIFSDGSDDLTQVYLLGTSVQIASGDGLNVNGGTAYVTGGCWFLNHRSDNAAAIRCSRGVVHVGASRFDGNFVNLVASGGGRIVADGNDFHRATSRDFLCLDSGSLEIRGGLVGGVPPGHPRTAPIRKGENTRLIFDQINLNRGFSGVDIVKISVSIFLFGQDPLSGPISTLNGDLVRVAHGGKVEFYFESAKNLSECRIRQLQFTEADGKVVVDMSFMPDGAEAGLLSMSIQ